MLLYKTNIRGDTMGRIRPTFIKRIAREIVEKYSKELSRDFYKNREFLEDKVKFPNDKMKNRVVGYVTTLVKREMA
ncbi:MAG TPA: 30S ribosomal protein S17e [Methanomicrobia archaeon]|nr:30S ribosomal protein S17e [Methanomicrobia archaeon]